MKKHTTDVFLQKYVKKIPEHLQTNLQSFTISLSSQSDIVKKEKEIQMGKFEQEAKDLLAAIGGKEKCDCCHSLCDAYAFRSW